MGIDVWVEREASLSNASNIETETISTKVQNVTTPVELPIVETETKETQVTETKKQINIETLNWQELRTTVAECQCCELSKTRNKSIFSSGKQTASLMIIGDAPSEEDEKQGEPFAGNAGKLLTAMLKAMGYQRNDVYISNLVKCRVCDNQHPSVEEVAACEPYLLRQINLVQPDLILVLGSVTAQRFLKSKATMGRLRGQLHYIDGINIPVVVSFEPDYLLCSPNEKRKAWEDLQLAMKELKSIESLKGTST